MSDSTIREPALRELVAAGSDVRLCLVGRMGGFALEVRRESYQRRLVSARGTLRVFGLDGAISFLRGIGVGQFEVDASSYEPGRIRKARPDRAQALRGTRTRLRQASLL